MTDANVRRTQIHNLEIVLCVCSLKSLVLRDGLVIPSLIPLLRANEQIIPFVHSWHDRVNGLLYESSAKLYWY